MLSKIIPEDLSLDLYLLHEIEASPASTRSYRFTINNGRKFMEIFRE